MRLKLSLTLVLALILAACASAEGQGWKRIDVGGSPPVRFDHTATLDTVNNKLVVFGGRDGSKDLGDTWVYDLESNSWNEVKGTTAPEARFGHAAAFDAESKRVLIFAGQAGVSFLNDVWAFDAASETWSKLDTQGTPPGVRYGTSAVITKRNLLIISHGFASGRFDDTIALDLGNNTWTQIKPIDEVPLNRCLHESVYDAKTDRMIMFGGCSSGYGPCPQDDAWSLDVEAKEWNEIKPSGSKPSGRSNPSLVSDDSGRLILFGGRTGGGRSSDIWTLDIASGKWTELTPSGEGPEPRSSHDAAWNPDTGQMIVFGGRSNSGNLNDLWLFTP